MRAVAKIASVKQWIDGEDWWFFAFAGMGLIGVRLIVVAAYHAAIKQDADPDDQAES